MIAETLKLKSVKKVDNSRSKIVDNNFLVIARRVYPVIIYAEGKAEDVAAVHTIHDFWRLYIVVTKDVIDIPKQNSSIIST